MIRALRQWHGRLWPLLALGVGAGLALSVRTRSVAGETPKAARGQPPAVAWSADGMVPTPKLGLLPGETPVFTEEPIFGDPGGALSVYQRGQVHVAVLTCDRCAVDHPDPVAYWAPGSQGDALPADARLLGGVIRGRSSFELPALVSSLQGELLLYSLGHGVVIGRVRLGGAP